MGFASENRNGGTVAKQSPQCRQLDRELGEVLASKAIVRLDADRWPLMGELGSGVSRSLTVARAALVILFIVGIALIMAGLVWLVDTAKWITRVARA